MPRQPVTDPDRDAADDEMGQVGEDVRVERLADRAVEEDAAVEAEELGVRQDQVQQMQSESTDPAVLRLLGKGEDLGKMLGLDKEWLARALTESDLASLRIAAFTLSTIGCGVPAGANSANQPYASML